MFGLIVKFVTHEGKREEFIRIMSTGFQDMEGCHSYILAKDSEEDNAVWVTEIWDTQEAHDVSVTLPRIQAVIAEAKPLMAGRAMRVVTEPIGGQGLR